MKNRIYSIVLGLFLVTACTKVQPVKITGEFPDVEDVATLTQTGSPLQETMPVNDDFEISYTGALKDGYYKIGSTDLFLANGFDLKLTKPESDSYYWLDPLTFTGNGAAENNLLQTILVKQRERSVAKMFSQFSTTDEEFSQTDEEFSQTDEEFSQADEEFSQADEEFDEGLMLPNKEYSPADLDATEQERKLRADLDDYKTWALQQLKSSKLHPLFVEMETKKIDTYIKYTLYDEIPYIPMEILKITDPKSMEIYADIEIPQSLANEVFDAFDINDEALFIADENQRNLVQKYTTYKVANGSENVSITNTVDFIMKNVTSQIIREHLLEHYTDETINNHPLEAETAYRLFNKYNSNTMYKKSIDAWYKIYEKTKPGSVSPKFHNYENYAGGTTSLDDFKGRYVYIDIWTTLCSPCIAQIPFLEKIEEKYKDKNIAFVSLSLDNPEDRDKWRNMIKTDNMGGIQLLADAPKSDFTEAYNIDNTGIPRFILIDPNGHIINSIAPKPSDPELVALLDGLDI